MSRLVKVSGFVIAAFLLIMAIFLAFTSRSKSFVYNGPIVDIPELKRISSELYAVSGSYFIYKIDTETNLPATTSFKIQSSEYLNDKTVSTTVRLEKDGEVYFLNFVDNALTGYMQMSEYNTPLEASLTGEWKNDEETLLILFEEYSSEAPRAIQRYMEVAQKPRHNA